MHVAFSNFQKKQRSIVYKISQSTVGLQAMLRIYENRRI